MGVIIRQPVHHIKDEKQKREEDKEKPVNFGVTKGLFLSRQQDGSSWACWGGRGHIDSMALSL